MANAYTKADDNDTVFPLGRSMILMIIAAAVLLCVFPEIATWHPDRMMGSMHQGIQ